MKLKDIFVGIIISLVLTSIYVSYTGLIDSTRLFGKDLIYRQQTEELLKGNLSLSQNPENTTLDLVLYNGKVQQVWGYGVPLLRLPFEVLAKICGFRFFPDRITLAFYIFLSLFISFISLCTVFYKKTIVKNISIYTLL
jgi:hypothetical protein